MKGVRTERKEMNFFVIIFIVSILHSSGRDLKKDSVLFWFVLWDETKV